MAIDPPKLDTEKSLEGLVEGAEFEFGQVW